MRINAPSGWISTDSLEDAPRHRSLALRWEDFEANHLEVAKGDQYGLAFPFTHDQFQEMGPTFLTAAFRAAGTLAKDNSVVAMRDYRVLDEGGASTSAAFDVEYQTPLPSLHTELFVKMPAADPARKFVSSHMLYGETQIAMRFAKLSMPTPVTQYYFGDYCQKTSNGILVTERIGFGLPPIERVLNKGLDHTVPVSAERYSVLTQLQAQLIAFHKRGGLGLEAEDVFPFRNNVVRTPAIEFDPLIDFIENSVGHLLPPHYTQADFISKLRSDGQQILETLPSLSSYIGRDVDYTGFCHANLNLDNAWFWRESDGTLKAGLIDWGAAGQMSIGQSFQGMLFAAEPAAFLSLRRNLVSEFVAAYQEASGVRLDAGKLLFHAKIASLLGLPLLIYAVQDALGHYSRADLASIVNAKDPRLSTDSGLGTLLAMTGTFLSEWSDTQAPRSVCEQVVQELSR